MKILMNINTLAPTGGAERSVLSVSAELIKRGHNVDLTVCKNTPPAYPIPEQLRVFYLDRARTFRIPTRISRFGQLYQAALEAHAKQHDYDVIIGWAKKGAPMVGWLPRNLKAVRLAALRNAPYHLLPPPKNILPLLKFYQRKHGFGRADSVLVQTPQILKQLPKEWQATARIIPNAVPVPRLVPGEYAQKEKLIIAVSRLIEDKRLDALILGFALFHKEFPDWRLEIWGHGRPWIEEKLNDLIGQKKLEGIVALKGVTSDLDSEYARARIMAHPSRREGMSNAVAEAMARGLPVVASADCAGIQELVRDRETGILMTGAGGVEPLAVQIFKALIELASKTDEAERLGRAARDFVLSKYSPQAIFDRWEEVIEDAVAERRRSLSIASQHEEFGLVSISRDVGEIGGEAPNSST